MKNFPVEQITSMPMLLILELITALIVLTVGLLIVYKFLNQESNKKKLLAGLLVGVVAGAAMIGVLYSVNAYVDNTNDSNLHAAVIESGESLTDEQFEQLKTYGAVNLSQTKIISFLDEGSESILTVFDASEHDKAQSEEDLQREKQIKENDF